MAKRKPVQIDCAGCLMVLMGFALLAMLGCVVLRMCFEILTGK